MGKIIIPILCIVILLIGIIAGPGWVANGEIINAGTSSEFTNRYINEYRDCFSSSMITRMRNEMPEIELNKLQKLNNKDFFAVINPKRLMWNEITCGTSRYLDGGATWIAIVKTCLGNGLCIWYIVDCCNAQKRAVEYNDQKMSKILNSFKS